jgi:hypothetical protein
MVGRGMCICVIVPSPSVVGLEGRRLAVGARDAVPPHKWAALLGGLEREFCARSNADGPGWGAGQGKISVGLYNINGRYVVVIGEPALP